MMNKQLSNSYVASDILSDDTSNQKGITTGHYGILLLLEQESSKNFMDFLLDFKISRDRMNNNIRWLLSKRLIRLSTVGGVENYSISEKGRFLVALFREYEIRAEDAESNVNIMTPFIKRLESVRKPIKEYLNNYAKEYETIGKRFILKAEEIQGIITDESEE